MKKRVNDINAFNANLTLSKDLSQRQFKTTNINILLNRVKLEKKNIFRKKLFIYSLIFLSVIFISNLIFN